MNLIHWMELAQFAGRLGIGILLFGVGLFGHLLIRKPNVEWAKSHGVKSPRVMVPLTGVLLILVSISVALGIWADMGFLSLFIYLLFTALRVHWPWREPTPEMRRAAQAHMIKDLLLAFAVLGLFSFVVMSGQGLAYSLTSPLLHYH